MTTQLAAAVTSFAICFLVLPVVIKYSLKKNIVDIPGERKIHMKVTPSMGGIAIFLGFIISSLIWIDIELWKEVRIIMIALLMTFFIGVRDDLIPLRPLTKILGQIMAAVILILVYDFRLVSLYGLFGISEIPLWVSYSLTIFTIIVITNSYNLIDGLDGLAGTVGCIVLIFYGVWFFLAGDTVFAVFSFSMLGALAAFLMFNWEPSKVFMGDTGAMVVGMTLAILSVRFIDFNFNLPARHPFRFSGSVSTAICLLIIPLVDTLRIFLIRTVRKQSPFTPDKNHVHHKIMQLGYSHSATAIILGTTQVLFITLAVLFHHTDDTSLLPGIVLLALTLILVLDWITRNRLTKKPGSLKAE